VKDAEGAGLTNDIGIHIQLAVISNTPPVFTRTVSNQSINVGMNLSVTNPATDADTPAQVLTYSLALGPTNATVNSNGIVSWRPWVIQGNTTNPFTVVVTDNGSPNLSATQAFSVVVNPLAQPSFSPPQLSNGKIGLTVSGQVGPDYAVQGSSNLVNWNTLVITNPAVMPFTWSTNASGSPMQFFRIKTGPPLP
jgi:hypothetical protein